MIITGFRTYTRDRDLLDSLTQHFAAGYEVSYKNRALIRSSFKKVAESLGIYNTNATIPVSQSTADFQYLVLKEAYDAEARKLITTTAPGNTNWRINYRRKKSKLPPSIVPAIIQRKADLNLITETEAEQLPGLGAKTANTLINRRTLLKRYTSWDQVKKEVGLSASAIEKLQDAAFIGEGTPEHINNAIASDVLDFGFQAFYLMVVSKEIEIEELTATHPQEILFKLITIFTGNLLEKPFRPKNWAPATRRLQRNNEALKLPEAKTLISSQDIEGASYLSGSAYLTVLKELIQKATTSIYVSMFYFYVGDLTGPSGEVLSLLIDAKNRGVDVKLILDTDWEGDYHNARSVNANTFTLLNTHQINYQTYYPDVSNHTKMVVIDQEHLVVGSHNWTISSFFRYQDTSFYVVSKDLGEQTTQYFTHVWKSLLVGETNWNIDLSLIETLNDSQREAFATANIHDAKALIKATRTTKQRETLASTTEIAEDTLHLLNDMLDMMQKLKIAETTAHVLVANGIRTLSALKKASVATVEAALQNTQSLQEPFNYRTIPEYVLNAITNL